MIQISQLSAAQLAHYASKELITNGFSNEGCRLIYHSLVLDENEPDGLRVLSCYFDTDNLEGFSAAILEYACSPDCPISKEHKLQFDELRFRAKWFWGFSQRKDGQKWLRTIDFGNRFDFIVDEERYQEWLIKPMIAKGGFLRNIVDAAHTFVGCTGKLLTHKMYGEKATFEEIYFPERFVKTPRYDQWLSNPMAVLE